MQRGEGRGERLAWEETLELSIRGWEGGVRERSAGVWIGGAVPG